MKDRVRSSRGIWIATDAFYLMVDFESPNSLGVPFVVPLFRIFPRPEKKVIFLNSACREFCVGAMIPVNNAIITNSNQLFGLITKQDFLVSPFRKFKEFLYQHFREFPISKFMRRGLKTFWLRTWVKEVLAGARVLQSFYESFSTFLFCWKVLRASCQQK